MEGSILMARFMLYERLDYHLALNKPTGEIIV